MADQDGVTTLSGRCREKYFDAAIACPLLLCSWIAEEQSSCSDPGWLPNDPRHDRRMTDEPLQCQLDGSRADLADLFLKDCPPLQIPVCMAQQSDRADRAATRPKTFDDQAGDRSYLALLCAGKRPDGVVISRKPARGVA